jgi:hypothetical protein
MVRFHDSTHTLRNRLNSLDDHELWYLKGNKIKYTHPDHIKTTTIRMQQDNR